MSIHYQEINVTSATFVKASPDVELGFDPTEWVIQNFGATNKLQYSFNGIDVHGDLPEAGNANNVPERSLSIKQRARQLWLRAPSGATTARIQAW